MGTMNIIDENGIEIKDLSVILTEYEDAFKEIYGADINLDQNSPDGQWLNIEAQAVRDILEFIANVYSSFDPDEAQGVRLDSLCAINNIERDPATYTYVDIDIIVSAAVNLVGLDDTTEDTPAADIASDVFTIADASGNEFVLATSQSFVAAGTYNVSFRAKEIGQVITTINTITTLISIIANVTSVNNPATASITGVDEESDTDLRLRRSKSVAIAASGFKESLYAKLINLDDVLDARILQNRTNATDGDGIPAYSIWVIVQGGTDTEIAQVIYDERYGGGMKGSESVVITEIDDNEMTINFDYAVNEDLYIDFKMQKLVGSSIIDFTYVKEQIVAQKIYKIGETANKSEIEKLVLNIIPNVYVQDLQVSNDDITYADTLATAAKENVFVLDTTRITIDYV